jgi:hypothetical protein
VADSAADSAAALRMTQRFWQTCFLEWPAWSPGLDEVNESSSFLAMRADAGNFDDG